MSKAQRNEWRRIARERFWEEYDRDTYVCPDCFGGGPFEVHHIDDDPSNNDLDNLIGLCHGCHNRRHRRANIRERLREMREVVEGAG